MKEKATMYDYARMCKESKSICYTCMECPLSMDNTRTGLYCMEYIEKFTDKANEIILNWCKEHPVETRQDRFLKMFPNTEKLSLGGLDICPKSTDKTYDCETFSHRCGICKRDYWLAEAKENEQ